MKKVVTMFLVICLTSVMCYAQYRNEVSPDSREIQHMLYAYAEQIDCDFLNGRTIFVNTPSTGSPDLEPLEHDILIVDKLLCKVILEQELMDQGILVSTHISGADTRVEIVITIDNTYKNSPLPLSSSPRLMTRSYSKMIMIWILYKDIETGEEILVDRLVMLLETVIQHKKNIYEEIDERAPENSTEYPVQPPQRRRNTNRADQV